MLFVLDYYAVIINETRIAMSLFLVKTGLPRLTRLTRDARKDEIPIVFAYNTNTVLASRNEAIHVILLWIATSFRSAP